MSATLVRNRPLIDAVIPGAGVVRDIALVAGGASLTAFCAQISIPWQPVPFTLQTLSVMLCGLALGVKRGGVSQLAYVGAGVAGVPVFNEGKSGLNILIGPTGGYLVAFGLVAMLLGYFAEKGWTTSILKTAAAMAIGDGLVLLVGSVWLSAFLGWKNALLHGVVPFLVPEFLKAIVVIIALPSAWKLVKR